MAVRQVGNFIAGKWEFPTDRGRGKSTNPADTREVVAEYVDGNRDDAKRAIEAAAAAFESWRRVPGPERGRVLARAAAIAMGRKKELAATMTREEGKLLSDAEGEIVKGVNLLEWYSGEGFRMGGKTVPSEVGNTFLCTVRIPLGVAGIITPWNFPWAIPCWKIAPALVAGNTVVFKPASFTVASACDLVEILTEAGLPPGVLNMVNGPGSTVGAEIAENEKVRAVSFTGSNEIGRRVHQATMDRMARVTLEMGGKNACIVMDDANLDLAAAGIVRGAFGGTGQRCTATSRLVVHKAVKEPLLQKIVAAAKAIKVGPGLEASSGMGPVVDRNQHQGVLGFIARAKAEGARVLCGGGKPAAPELAHGWFVEPTILDDVTQDMEVWREEVFGPVLAVIVANDFDHAMALANDSKYGLSSAFYSENSNLVMRYVEGIESGMVHVNSPTIGGEAQVPFGGMKATGHGEREMSEEGLHFFTEQKTVWIDYTGKPRTTNIY